jgi:Tfp pilus assembly protein PilN
VREIEFLPQEYSRARFKRRVGFIRSWLLLATGLAMVLWSLQMGVWVRDARAELQALRGTASAVDADVEKVRLLRAEAHTFNRRLACLRNLMPQVTATAILGDLVALLPDQVTIEALELLRPHGGGPDTVTLRLSGAAPRETLVTDTLSVLDASPRFCRVLLAESKPTVGETDGRRSFVIQADVAPPAPAKEK